MQKATLTVLTVLIVVVLILTFESLKPYGREVLKRFLIWLLLVVAVLVAPAVLIKKAHGHGLRHHHHHFRHHHRHAVAGAGEIVSHPSGCPHVAFCGCGAAVKVFGAPVRSLWLAANWFRFPRTSPAPGMVAVRRHHVFVLEADLGGGVWRVYDANSGRHLTRVHARAIAGYAIVDPHGRS